MEQENEDLDENKLLSRISGCYNLSKYNEVIKCKDPTKRLEALSWECSPWFNSIAATRTTLLKWISDHERYYAESRKRNDTKAAEDHFDQMVDFYSAIIGKTRGKSKFQKIILNKMRKDSEQFDKIYSPSSLIEQAVRFSQNGDNGGTLEDRLRARYYLSKGNIISRFTGDQSQQILSPLSKKWIDIIKSGIVRLNESHSPSVEECEYLTHYLENLAKSGCPLDELEPEILSLGKYYDKAKKDRYYATHGVTMEQMEKPWVPNNDIDKAWSDFVSTVFSRPRYSNG